MKCTYVTMRRRLFTIFIFHQNKKMVIDFLFFLLYSGCCDKKEKKSLKKQWFPPLHNGIKWARWYTIKLRRTTLYFLLELPCTVRRCDERTIRWKVYIPIKFYFKICLLDETLNSKYYVSSDRKLTVSKVIDQIILYLNNFIYKG